MVRANDVLFEFNGDGGYTLFRERDSMESASLDSNQFLHPLHKCVFAYTHGR